MSAPTETLEMAQCWWCDEETEGTMDTDDFGPIFTCGVCDRITHFAVDGEDFDGDDYEPECPQFWDGTGPNFW